MPNKEEKQMADSESKIMNLKEYCQIVAMYAGLFDSMIRGAGITGGVKDVLNSVFDAPVEYQQAVDLVKFANPQKQNIILEFVIIRRVIHSLVQFLADRDYDVVFLSPDIWFPTWFIRSNDYREDPWDERVISGWKIVEKDMANATVHTPATGSCFLVSHRGNFLGIFYKSNDEKTFAEIGSEVLFAGGLKTSCSNGASNFLQDVGFIPVSCIPMEEEFLPDAWKGTDKEDNINMLVHRLAIPSRPTPRPTMPHKPYPFVPVRYTTAISMN